MDEKQISLRVCYFGTYRAAYSRNRIMMEGLRRNGVQVVECHEPLWHGIEDRVQAVRGGWKRPAFFCRVLRTYIRLLRRYWRMNGDYDILIVGYPGHFDVFLARLVSWWHRRPLVWDIFMSIYLIALERELDVSSPVLVDLIRRIEGLACRLPDFLVLDTAEYVAWFGKTHGVPADRFRLVPTGADTTLFRPLPCTRPDDGRFRVIYYGSFIPNHGVPTIVEAARLLADVPKIQFELIGQGPERERAEQLVEKYHLANVTFVDWLDQQGLMERVAEADLCLGVFGNTPQSLMTVQNKIYECLAMARPVLTGDGPAVRRALQHGEHVYLCPRADPQALAEAIRELEQDSLGRANLAWQGHRRCQEHFSVERIGCFFRAHLGPIIGPDSL